MFMVSNISEALIISLTWTFVKRHRPTELPEHAGTCKGVFIRPSYNSQFSQTHGKQTTVTRYQYCTNVLNSRTMTWIIHTY